MSFRTRRTYSNTQTTSFNSDNSSSISEQVADAAASSQSDGLMQDHNQRVRIIFRIRVILLWQAITSYTHTDILYCNACLCVCFFFPKDEIQEFAQRFRVFGVR